MKRIMAIIAVVISTFALVSCSSKMTAKFKLTSVSELRESLVFDFLLEDKDDCLKDSDFNYSLTKKGEKKVLKSNKLVFEEDEDYGSVTISGLEAGTEYTVRFTAGFEGKEVELAKRNCTTSTKGIEEAPYEISSAEDFNTLVKNDNNAYFKLTQDIDFKGDFVDPMFSSSKQFMGHFDGQGHTLKNIRVGKEDAYHSYGSNSYMGLFGYVGSKGIIENLKFDDVKIYAKRSSTGYFAILAGCNEGEIKDITITNALLSAQGTTSEYYVGGLVAANRAHGNITNCVLDVNIDAKASRSMYVGGIFAINAVENEHPIRNITKDSTYKGDIKVTIDSTNDNAYTTNVYVGGIAAKNSSSIENVKAEANIDVKTNFKNPHKTEYKVYVGGLVGNNLNDSAVLRDSKITGNINVEAMDALEIYVGLIAGVNGFTDYESRAIIENCEYTLPTDGKVTVKTYYREEAVEPETNPDTEGSKEETTTNEEAAKLAFKYGIGLVGLDLVNENPSAKNYNTASEFDILFNLYNRKAEGETEDPLKETRTIKVTKLA